MIRQDPWQVGRTGLESRMSAKGDPSVESRRRRHPVRYGLVKCDS